MTAASLRTLASALAASAVMALAACGSSRTASPAPAPAGDNDDNVPRQSVDPDAPGFVLPDPHAKGLRPVERPD
ncbi:MAG: hypothetical protein K2L62_06485, partial [Muribaculaceae bacterium]|nr:hypothetical protein [Muribaculaceae bacterium]